MNKKVVIKPIAVAIGATMLGSLAQLPNAAAEQNPFAMKSLANGYDVAFSSRKHEEAEGKCGGEKKAGAEATSKAAEGSCGEAVKAKEGSCGESKAKEGSCGESKAKEGSCGESKSK